MIIDGNKEIILEMPKHWKMIHGISVSDSLTVGLLSSTGTKNGKVIRFYNADGSVHHDLILPYSAYTIHFSPDCLKLTAVGIQQITQIDLDW